MSFLKVSINGASLLVMALPVFASDVVTSDVVTTSDSGVEETLVMGRKGDYSVITENAQKIIDVPGSLGDPLMAVFSLPGVISEGDGGGAPAVRGSSPSDNLYLVDGAPAGYVFHQFSTSIFNENIIQDFELFSAGFGPRYSNVVGGVFDIKLRDPKKQEIATTLDVSMLRAGLFVEGEATENSAFYLSGRSSLLQYFFEPEDVEEEEGIRVQDAPEDTDYQFKYQYSLNDSNKLTLSANGASDLAAAEFTELSSEVLQEPDFAGDAKIKNTFNNQSLRWQFDASKAAMFDVQVGHYENRGNTFWGDKQYFFDMTKEDTYLLVNTAFLVNETHSFSLGAEHHNSEYSYDARFINYVCTEFDPDCEWRRGDLIDTQDVVEIQEHMVYANDHWQLTDAVAIDLGAQMHYNDFTGETFTHPRVAATWKFADSWAVITSAGSYNRLPDIDKSFPLIGNPELKSPTSNHYTLELKQELANEWSWSLTTYYKTMEDLPLSGDATDETQPLYTNDMEGEAYGVDLFINKGLVDRWYGWLALSASRSTRTNTLTGVEQDYYLDTPWVLNGVINYQLTDMWNMGARLTVQSGRAITPIIGIRENPFFDNHILPVYGEPYSDNLPTYARLDLRFKRDMTLWGYQGTYNIDILNVLNRRNVADRSLDYKRTTSPENIRLEDEVGMGLIPAVGMSLTF